MIVGEFVGPDVNVIVLVGLALAVFVGVFVVVSVDVIASEKNKTPSTLLRLKYSSRAPLDGEYGL